ncbi:hypothetical protein IQ230_09695 [Gloeocapsopsis crepidinum LEGE 06123]|uniref:CpcD n=1 Tax=Gloeocapsopsis crepidinum LEGE 06123 TaxID=588587 RepID=A0ABR9UQU2_9CHRO|nr:hypothetical protein [Gloeocapsopsis crepidinum]MBE9190629.1 hypothetical protein [Gloeocapsopsis crepidinum LEGE 06123]
MSSTPAQKLNKFLNANTYEAGKTKKRKTVIPGNIGGVPNPQPASNPHAVISAPNSTKLGRRLNITGENVASSVTKRRDLEQIQRRLLVTTENVRLRRAGR